MREQQGIGAVRAFRASEEGRRRDMDKREESHGEEMRG